MYLSVCKICCQDPEGTFMFISIFLNKFAFFEDFIVYFEDTIWIDKKNLETTFACS